MTTIIGRLNDAGYSAYAVGGCVRDTLLGRRPKDWDICTSARPEDMQRVFAGEHVVETGLKHGTLTVVLDHVPYEVTTYRVDGAYTDHRHPDGVTFVTDVREDLARRDFTVNAMAYHPREGLIDAFDGQEDLRRRVIRCVGRPDERFEEDALRILRALRFAAVYSFQLEEETLAAARRLAPTLTRVAPERVRVELGKLLCGDSAGDILRLCPEILGVVIPELLPSVGFDQRTPHHRYDVWEHTIRTVEGIRPTEAARLAMLFHDLGKPETFTLDERGGHFYGHPKASARIADTVLTRLRVDNATHDLVCTLVEHHDIDLTPEEPLLLRRLNRFGEDTLRLLIEVHRADQLGKGTVRDEDVYRYFDVITEALDALIDRRPCFSLKQLRINGSDLLALGLKGPAVGRTLNALLEEVMEGTTANLRGDLLARARAIAGE